MFLTWKAPNWPQFSSVSHGTETPADCRGYDGWMIDLRRFSALACVSLLVASVGCVAHVDNSFITGSQITLERCTGSSRPPHDCRFVPMLLDDDQQRRLQELMIAARRREAHEAREA